MPVSEQLEPNADYYAACGCSRTRTRGSCCGRSAARMDPAGRTSPSFVDVCAGPPADVAPGPGPGRSGARSAPAAPRQPARRHRDGRDPAGLARRAGLVVRAHRRRRNRLADAERRASVCPLGRRSQHSRGAPVRPRPQSAEALGRAAPGGALRAVPRQAGGGAAGDDDRSRRAGVDHRQPDHQQQHGPLAELAG